MSARANDANQTVEILPIGSQNPSFAGSWPVTYTQADVSSGVQDGSLPGAMFDREFTVLATSQHEFTATPASTAQQYIGLDLFDTPDPDTDCPHWVIGAEPANFTANGTSYLCTNKHEFVATSGAGLPPVVPHHSSLTTFGMRPQHGYGPYSGPGAPGDQVLPAVSHYPLQTALVTRLRGAGLKRIATYLGIPPISIGVLGTYGVGYDAAASKADGGGPMPVAQLCCCTQETDRVVDSANPSELRRLYFARDDGTQPLVRATVDEFGAPVIPPGWAGQASYVLATHEWIQPSNVGALPSIAALGGAAWREQQVAVPIAAGQWLGIAFAAPRQGYDFADIGVGTAPIALCSSLLLPKCTERPVGHRTPGGRPIYQPASYGTMVEIAQAWSDRDHAVCWAMEFDAPQGNASCVEVVWDLFLIDHSGVLPYRNAFQVPAGWLGIASYFGSVKRYAYPTVAPFIDSTTNPAPHRQAVGSGLALPANIGLGIVLRAASTSGAVSPALASVRYYVGAGLDF